jgi:hypothetical protein
LTGERPVKSGDGRESLRGRNGPGEPWPRPELIFPGAKKGTGFSRGIKPSERRIEAGKVLVGSARAEGEVETPFRPRGRRKALKGEAHERGELKEASRGGTTEVTERVAKP